MIKDCKDQLSRLMGSSVSTSKLAARASAIVGRYWPELTGKQRIQLQHWLDAQYAESQKLVATSRLNERVRKAEMATGAIEAIKKKAPPERG
jgi:hypothetical protein